MKLRIDKAIWLLIYGGMVLIALGLTLRQGDAFLGWIVFGLGVVATVAGVTLIGVRSHVRDEP